VLFSRLDVYPLAPSWSPAGGRIAFVSARLSGSTLDVLSSGLGDVRELATASALSRPRWSLDGGWVAVTDDKGLVKLVRSDGGVVRMPATGLDPEFSPDGKLVAYGREGNLWVSAAAGGDERLIASTAGRVRTLLWSPDGTRIAFSTGNDRVDASFGNDVVYGGEGIDVLNGQAGADRLFGGPGTDYLAGGTGHDHIDGGRGEDWIDVVDGAGGDVVVCGPSRVRDIVRADRGDRIARDCERVRRI
jgi:dipeptidyl aminopeptidase/acylaminoacyl peptidase